MNSNLLKQNEEKFQNQEGTALIIALLIMVLLMGFVALAISRTNSETVAAANDAAETRTFEASQASLEVMTRNFDKIFDRRLNPSGDDLQRVQDNKPPGFDGKYDFLQLITKTKNSQQVVMTGGEFQGLRATRDEWEIKARATDKANGTQVELRRRFFNNRIPIFQFGIFYEDDMEFHPGPRFDFGGRVHSNGNLFLMGGAEVLFSSKVTAVGEVFTDIARNDTYTWADNVKIKNASGTFVQLKKTMGSVLKSPANGDAVFSNPDMPTVYRNANWQTEQNKFEGNLLFQQKPLELPIRFNSRFNSSAPDYIELVKRGKNVGDLLNSTTPVTGDTQDNEVTAKERYYNKTGIRVSIADSKAKLPGCATGIGTAAVAGRCGIRMDGAPAPGDAGSEPSGGEVRGYQPLTMKDGYQATELNGERFNLGIAGRQMWVKIETVRYDETTNTYITKDITEDMLSLGITERAKNIIGTQNFILLNKFTGGRSYGLDIDSEKNRVDNRSIFKFQRFLIEGAKIANLGNKFMTSETINTTDVNYILAAKRKMFNPSKDNDPVGVNNDPYGNLLQYSDNGTFTDKKGHWWEAIAKDNVPNDLKRWVVPFPINMFDAREGLYNVAQNYSAGNVPWNGVMSLIDIDVANLRRFFNGEFDNNFPNGTKFATEKGSSFKSTDVPQDHGWVLYISDRRGDYDFDGEYDMEDIYGNNDGVMQTGEDVNNNGLLDTDYCNEAVRYTTSVLGCETNPVISTAIASIFEHKFYRRGVRLINGTTLPGDYDSVYPANTKGFTVASENAVYVLGNYNSTGATRTYDANSNEIMPTPSTSYQPQGTNLHIPASIVADTVFVLSNNWKDAANWANPFSSRTASETSVRFAMISGDARSRKLSLPNQGSGDACMAGGVHNFKRFLENWSGVRLNYTGSLINLYNARNNNGAHKSDGKVYGAPQRNWTFDTSFLDPDRLPPGTPFFQSIQLTGFERLN